MSCMMLDSYYADPSVVNRRLPHCAQTKRFSTGLQPPECDKTTQVSKRPVARTNEASVQENDHQSVTRQDASGERRRKRVRAPGGVIKKRRQKGIRLVDGPALKDETHHLE